MTFPVVGIIGNAHLVNREYPVHSGGRMISVAVRDVASGTAVPLPMGGSRTAVAKEGDDLSRRRDHRQRHLVNREYPDSGGRMISVAVRDVAGAVPLICPGLDCD